MTWYILVLISVVCEALESVIDKILVVAKETQIDGMIASFFRNLGFFVFVCIAGVMGIFGPMEFFVSPGIVLLGMIWIINSLIYDTLLKHAELSRFSGILFLFPLLLLILDIFLFGESFSPLQMCALGLLFYGAFQLSLDRSSGTHKSVFSLKIWGLMFLKFLIYALGFALFKWYHIHQGLNEISFYFSTWVFVMLTYICVICVLKKQTMIVSTAVQDGFLLKTLGAKFFDFLSGIFLLQAIALTTITSAKALQSILPLVILMMTFWIQRSGISLKEEFHFYKYVGIGCIVIGSMLLILVSG